MKYSKNEKLKMNIVQFIKTRNIFNPIKIVLDFWKVYSVFLRNLSNYYISLKLFVD